jgi:1-deoxy-D-xylulose-5-phosphate reductoisomerase
MPKNVTILGSSGSIGTASLRTIEELGPEYRVVGLAANSQWKTLVEQALKYRPSAVAISESKHYRDVADALSAEPIDVYAGSDGLCDLVRRDDCRIVIAAIVGAAGLVSTLSAVEAGRQIGLANKEPVVMAGELMMEMAARTGAKIIPVDSEHSAVFQAMQSGRHQEIRRIILTSSGGPFRQWPAERIANATVEDALKHPTWSMGPKITVDSATMFNKALEVVEARWLFGVEPSRIEVLIHPESIVHSMVEFRDGSTIAQLGTADMCIPIQYALTYPEREESHVPRLDLAEVGRLHFERPDEKRFPALKCGFSVARRGGTAGAVCNGANEAANIAFRSGRLQFGRIAELTCDILDRHEWSSRPNLDELINADRWARGEVAKCLTH